jgi:peptidoglycan/xylan/chitin deacetylase (PgdA/CDA1 family)
MSFRHLLGSVRWAALSAAHRRDFRLSGAAPIVSFTFDDFPQSALHVGGAILKSYGACGTFYAAMGLMGQVNALGQQFCAEDLQTLLHDGHELGSHTFGHLSCRSTSLPTFAADVLKGKRAVEEIVGAEAPHQFSYPYGHVTLRIKPRVGTDMATCRGIVPGLNGSKVDLNLLRANSLYSRSLDLEGIHWLLEFNERRRGWLIFYTHDVSDSPSPFGCTPKEFESVVRLAVQGPAKVLPIGRALLRVRSCPIVSNTSYD